MIHMHVPLILYDPINQYDISFELADWVHPWAFLSMTTRPLGSTVEEQPGDESAARSSRVSAFSMFKSLALPECRRGADFAGKN